MQFLLALTGRRLWRGLLALIVAASPRLALAACLNGNPSVADEYRESQFVVVGRVLSARDVPDRDEPDFFAGTHYAVRVTRVFKGHPPTRMMLWSENSSGRFPMDVGSDYLLFLSPVKGQPLAVDDCGNSALLRASGTALTALQGLTRRR